MRVYTVRMCMQSPRARDVHTRAAGPAAAEPPSVWPASSTRTRLAAPMRPSTRPFRRGGSVLRTRRWRLLLTVDPAWVFQGRRQSELRRLRARRRPGDG